MALLHNNTVKDTPVSYIEWVFYYDKPMYDGNRDFVASILILSYWYTYIVFEFVSEYPYLGENWTNIWALWLTVKVLWPDKICMMSIWGCYNRATNHYRWVYFVFDYITTSNIIIYRRKHIVSHLSTCMMWFSMYEGFITIIECH